MGHYTGPKVRLSRRVGAPVCETQKHINRRETRPGMHGFRRGRQTLYGLQLAEKQKIAYYYDVRDKQMRKYMSRASKGKTKADEALQQMLESRLDNIVRRAGWARTIWQARQMVAHAHFEVNGKKVDIPSYHCKPGDIVTVREKSQAFVKNVAQTAEAVTTLEWLTVDENALKATVNRLPALEEVRLPFEVDYAKIIEFYTR